MSIENVKKFLNLAKTDESVKGKLSKIIERLQKKGELLSEEKFIKNEIIPIARKKGIAFTTKDFLNYAAQQMSALSEEDLLNVSGGLSTRNTAAALLITFLGSLGVGAAVNLSKIPQEDQISISATKGKEDAGENYSQDNFDEENIKNEVNENNASIKDNSEIEPEVVENAEDNNKSAEPAVSTNLGQNSERKSENANATAQKNLREAIQNKNVILPNNGIKNDNTVPQTNTQSQTNTDLGRLQATPHNENIGYSPLLNSTNSGDSSFLGASTNDSQQNNHSSFLNSTNNSTNWGTSTVGTNVSQQNINSTLSSSTNNLTTPKNNSVKSTLLNSTTFRTSTVGKTASQKNNASLSSNSSINNPSFFVESKNASDLPQTEHAENSNSNENHVTFVLPEQNESNDNGAVNTIEAVENVGASAENTGANSYNYTPFTKTLTKASTQVNHLIKFLNNLPKTSDGLPDLNAVSKETAYALESDIRHVAEQISYDDKQETYSLFGRHRSYSMPQEDLKLLKDLDAKYNSKNSDLNDVNVQQMEYVENIGASSKVSDTNTGNVGIDSSEASGNNLIKHSNIVNNGDNIAEFNNLGFKSGDQEYNKFDFTIGVYTNEELAQHILPYLDNFEDLTPESQRELMMDTIALFNSVDNGKHYNLDQLFEDDTIITEENKQKLREFYFDKVEPNYEEITAPINDYEELLTFGNHRYDVSDFINRLAPYIENFDNLDVESQDVLLHYIDDFLYQSYNTENNTFTIPVADNENAEKIIANMLNIAKDHILPQKGEDESSKLSVSDYLKGIAMGAGIIFLTGAAAYYMAGAPALSGMTFLGDGSIEKAKENFSALKTKATDATNNVKSKISDGISYATNAAKGVKSKISDGMSYVQKWWNGETKTLENADLPNVNSAYTNSTVTTSATNLGEPLFDAGNLPQLKQQPQNSTPLFNAKNLPQFQQQNTENDNTSLWTRLFGGEKADSNAKNNQTLYGNTTSAEQNHSEIFNINNEFGENSFQETNTTMTATPAAPAPIPRPNPAPLYNQINQNIKDESSSVFSKIGNLFSGLKSRLWGNSNKVQTVESPNWLEKSPSTFTWSEENFIRFTKPQTNNLQPKNVDTSMNNALADPGTPIVENSIGHLDPITRLKRAGGTAEKQNTYKSGARAMPQANGQRNNEAFAKLQQENQNFEIKPSTFRPSSSSVDDTGATKSAQTLTRIDLPTTTKLNNASNAMEVQNPSQNQDLNIQPNTFNPHSDSVNTGGMQVGSAGKALKQNSENVKFESIKFSSVKPQDETQKKN